MKFVCFTIICQNTFLRKETVIMLTSSASGFLKGAAAGMVIGAAAMMIADPLSDRERRKLVRKTEGVFKSMGGIIDNAISMFR